MAVALFVGVLFAGLVFLVHPWYDATNDGSMYIACARSILAGEGYAYLGEPFRIRPPGLSYLIAPLIAWRGTDFHALNLYVSAFGALAAFLAYRFQRPRIGWLVALLAALALWANPGFQRSCTQVMSEMPGIALMLAALLVERRSRASSRHVGWELLLGVLIAAATYVRSVNLLLIPAVALARLVGRFSADQAPTWGRFLAGRLAVFAGVALLLMLPWGLRNAAVDTPPPADQTYLYTYATGMFHEDAGDPRSRRLGLDEILARIPSQTGKTIEVLGRRMDVTLPLRTRQLARGAEWTSERERGPLVVVTAVVLLAGSLYGLLKRRGASDIFTWLTLGIVAIYFGFDDRLLMPVYVLAFPATLEALRDLGTGLRSPRAGTLLAGGAAVAVLAIDFEPRADWERIERQHEAFIAIAAAAEPLLDDDARIAAPVSWHYAVYLDRPVWSLQWAGFRAMRSGQVPQAAAEQLIDAYDLNTVVLSPLVPVDNLYLPYFLQRNLRRAEQDPVHVVRVRL